VVAHGPRRALWAGRGKGWVSPTELVELNAHLRAIAALLRRPRRRDDDQLVSVCFVLAPIAAQPTRRGRGRAPRAAPAARAARAPRAGRIRARGSSGGGARRRTS
jgi:hypothetical protein